jgi:hypothetical protein
MEAQRPFQWQWSQGERGVGATAARGAGEGAMISRILSAFAAAVVLLPGLAGAEGGEFSRSGFYLGLGGIYTQNGLLEDQLGDFLPFGIEIDDSGGLSAQLGYRAFPFLATELEYDYVSPYDLGAAGITIASLESHLFTANLKTILPIWRIQPYLLGGIGFVTWKIDDKLGVGGLDQTDTDLAGRVGGGVDLHLTSRISLNAGANVVFSNTSLSSSIPGSQDIDYLSYISVGAGLRYRFWSLSGE